MVGQNSQNITSRPTLIREYCLAHDIQFLTHFTQLKNLPGILNYGLLDRETMERNPNMVRPLINDLKRLDKCRNAICVSISFPNHKMFYNYRQGRDGDWVVIKLKPSILWELDCAFCAENAASKKVTCIPLEKRKSIEALKKLFEDYDGVNRAEEEFLSQFPTSPQAEVLVFNSIPIVYFDAICTHNSITNQDWELISSISGKILREKDETLFGWRIDRKSMNYSSEEEIPF